MQKASNTRNDHCQIVRDEFLLIDLFDAKALKTFFVRYKYFTTNDLAQILSYSSRQIRCFKTRANVTNSRKTSPSKNIEIPTNIKLEQGWDCLEWWRKHYPKYGSITLAKITGLSPSTVRRRLRKYGIEIMSHEVPDSPYYNYEWLYKHYVTLDWGLIRCGKAAGVSPDTISSWLNSHNIQVKGRYGPSVARAWKGGFVGKAPGKSIRTS